MTTATTVQNVQAGAAIAPRTISRPKRTGRERREAWEALLFLSPWIIGFVLFTAGPIVASLVLSFCKWDMVNPIEWVGTENYRQMTRDPLLAKSLVNTVAYALMYIPGAVIVSLLLAMMLNQNLPGIRVFRTIYYLPTLTQGVATYVLWSVVFEPQGGILNRTLRPVTHLFGVEPPRWLHDPMWAKIALVIMALWGVGGAMLVFLAGLKNIPEQLYEAADIDGAGPIGQFFHVTLPMLSPTIFFNTIMATIASFQVFAAALILTKGGPSNSTLFYVYYLYNRAFYFFNMGYASAMAWLLFLIILALTALQMWASRKWVHYG